MDSVLLDLLRNRRSIRAFKSQAVEAEKVETLVEAAVRTPTSRGRNPWEFIVITDPELLKALGQAKEHGSLFLANAPLAIVFAADTTVSDAWTEDCSIAAFTVQLTAEEIGLASCWAQIRLRQHDSETSSGEFIKQLLSMPDSLSVECVIGIGYPDEEKAGHSYDHLPFDKVHRNAYT